MKKINLLLTLLFFVGSLTAQNVFTNEKQENPVSVEENSEKKTGPTIDFESKVVDYGVIAHNSDGNRKYVFKNNGTEPLIIKNAKGSCGCTVPSYPREPIMPGSSAEIGVKYATNRVGKFTKTITLTTNADTKPVILTIKGEVSPPKKEATVPEKSNNGAPLEKN
tara:strand:- start:1063 stop:1557 length:495 start_codon:yes stop_codon:yes gene_type:complete